MDIENEVKRLVAVQLDLEVGIVKKDSKIIEDLGADSLDLVELIITLEEAFDLGITDAEADGFKTVGDIVAYVEREVG